MQGRLCRCARLHNLRLRPGASRSRHLSLPVRCVEGSAVRPGLGARGDMLRGGLRRGERHGERSGVKYYEEVTKEM